MTPVPVATKSAGPGESLAREEPLRTDRGDGRPDREVVQVAQSVARRQAQRAEPSGREKPT